MSDSTSSVTSSLFGGLRSSGLMSGLDTESIVKQMASATKNQINSKQQKIDMLSWKQDAYRSVIDKFNTFKNTYFNSLSMDTNIKSNYLMGSYAATSSDSRVTATASTSATNATYNITGITQLAKKAEITGSYGTGNLTNGIKLDFANATSGKDYAVSITLDGRTEDIAFKAGSNADATIAALNTALSSKFGSNTLKVTSDGNLNYANSDGISHSYSVAYAKETFTGTDAEIIQKQTESLKALGINSDLVSNKVSVKSKLSDINFATPLSGGTYSFSINGKDYTFTGNDSVSDVIDAVNADGTAKISFNSLSQTFSIASSKEGAASSLNITQNSGNLLNSLFGADTIGKGNLGSLSLKNSGITGTELTSTNFNDNKNSQFEVTVNGVKKTIGLWGYNTNGVKNEFDDVLDDDGKTVKTKGTDKVISELNKQLTAEFGSNAPKFKYSDDKKSIVLEGAKGLDTVSINAIDDDEKSKALISKLGFSTTSVTTNELTESSKAYDLIGKTGTFKVGDRTISITEATTLGDLKTQLGDKGTINMNTGSIVAYDTISAEGAENQNFAATLFNSKYADLNSYTASSASDRTINSIGQNAIVTINGVKISNASNSIEIDGTTINIGNLSETAASEISDTKPITITSQRDTTKAFDAVVKFVDSYNKLIDELYGEINTKRPKSKNAYYDPLTDEQRDAMKEKEIEKWEEKAKTGLLYADGTISNALSDIRTAMSKYTSENFSLYDMGITVSTDYKEHGKLKIDEAKLKTAFEKNPDQIQKLFTDPEDGLAVSVENAINKAVSTSGTTGYGTLTRLAGVANTTTATENTISKQISLYQDVVDSLKTRYDNEVDRYWSQFTALETAMSKYNMQASLFSNNQ